MTGFEKFTRQEIAAKLTKVAEDKGIEIDINGVTIYDAGSIGVNYYDWIKEAKGYFEFNAFADFSYFGGEYTNEMEGWFYSTLATMSMDAVRQLEVK